MRKFFVPALTLILAVVVSLPVIAQDDEVILDFYYPVQVVVRSLR